MFRRRRPLLRAAAVGGGAYLAGKHVANRQAEGAQVEADQDERIGQLEHQQQDPRPGAARPAARRAANLADDRPAEPARRPASERRPDRRRTRCRQGQGVRYLSPGGPVSRTLTDSMQKGSRTCELSIVDANERTARPGTTLRSLNSGGYPGLAGVTSWWTAASSAAYARTSAACSSGSSRLPGGSPPGPTGRTGPSPAPGARRPGRSAASTSPNRQQYSRVTDSSSASLGSAGAGAC